MGDKALHIFYRWIKVFSYRRCANYRLLCVITISAFR